MEEKRNIVIPATSLDLDVLMRLQQRPALFSTGEPIFWDDPHIAKQMLAAHLDPQADAASRRPHIIDREIAWLMAALQLREGMTAIDLGCGPGLYAARLARRRVGVTGIDYSRTALAYAREHAETHNLGITYVYQDYLTLDVENRFDAALLVNGDFCVLSPPKRSELLSNVHRALRPGGRFALDVFTPQFRDSYMVDNRWYVAEQGFWRPGRHAVLEVGFAYPRESVFVNQYVVIEADGTVTVYRNWFQTYTLAAITRELEANGFLVEWSGSNLMGGAYSEQSDWIGIVAQKPPLLG